MRLKSAGWLISVALGLLGLCSGALGATAGPLDRVEGLVMPGEVIRGHQHVEKKCNQCHERFDRTKQTKLCLECHKDVGVDLKEKKSFHGKITNIQKRECPTCHTDHKGREMDIVQFDEELFDHAQTNYKLLGAHVKADCRTCHSSRKTYRVKSSKCIDCHEKDDGHKQRFGKECDNCHRESGWLPAYFDHEKTDFPLKYMHKETECQWCHVNERYKGTPRNCYFCHYLDDAHEGDRGRGCQECHAERGWAVLNFDHDKDTDFKLGGAHKPLQCLSCHKDNIFSEKTAIDCFSCHEIHDAHGGLYGKQCDSCHSEAKWSELRFKHDQDTEYPLKGAHKKVACVACHRTPVFAEASPTPKSCIGCHKVSDVHRGQVGEKCEKCHNEEAWIEKVVFDHDLTKFPLHSSHSLVTCEDCHLSNRYQGSTVKCGECHVRDDVHKQRLGKACEACHNAKEWMAWSFDHTKKTEYPLTGAHEGLDCHACHAEKVVKKITLPKTCFGCHEKDDVHGGRLGRSCETCHVTKSFKILGGVAKEKPVAGDKEPVTK